MSDASSLLQTRSSSAHARLSQCIEIDESGLILGAGTRLMRMSGSPKDQGLDLDADRERFLALLSVVTRRPVSADLLVHVEAASTFWQRGDKAVANLRRVFARLPHCQEPADADRLSQAEYCLDQGLTPRSLMKALGFDTAGLDLIKYDPNQARVPAGSGPTSGRWGSGSGGSGSSSGAFIGPALAAARAAGPSFLRGGSPELIEALATFAARFATPTAILGALLIPTPNNGGVTDGALPGAPDIRFKKDGPEGTLQITTRTDDGADVVVRAENQRGVYVDVETGKPIGRDFGDQMYLDLDSVHAALDAALQPEDKEKPKPWVATDEPKLCPAPTPDTPHGASDRAKNYEDDVHARVNPLAPIPRGFGVKVINPATGDYVYFEDCFRYAGDLVDGDMKPGDLAEAKGPRTEFLYSKDWSAMDNDVKQAKKQLDTADARGVGLKWYYAEPGAAVLARERFGKEGLDRVVIGTMPPRERR